MSRDFFKVPLTDYDSKVANSITPMEFSLRTLQPESQLFRH